MIETVKLQRDSWLVNGNMSVPNDPNNSECVAVLAWIEEGNTPDPQFTDEEIADNTQAEINTTNQAYLASTDWYASRKADTGEAIPSDIVTARAAARDAIV